MEKRYSFALLVAGGGEEATGRFRISVLLFWVFCRLFSDFGFRETTVSCCFGFLGDSTVPLALNGGTSATGSCYPISDNCSFTGKSLSAPIRAI